MDQTPQVLPTAMVASSTTDVGPKPPPQQTKAASQPKATSQRNQLAPTEDAPYGYKVVKVRKPDGTIIQVKRPLKAGEEPPKPLSPPVKTTPPQTSASTTSQVDTVQIPVRNASKRPLSQGSKDKSTTGQAAGQVAKPGHTKSPPSGPVPAPSAASKSKPGIQVSEKELPDSSQTSPKTPAGGAGRISQANLMSNVLQVASWSIMIAFSGLFLALAVAALALNNKPAGPNAKLVQAKDIAISVWPVIFAAIVAQTLKAYAAYKVERGIKLVTLEQLVTSHSFASSIKQPFTLRKVNWTSVLLFIIWGLSPLAGQALVRMVSVRDLKIEVQRPALFFRPNSIPNNLTELALSSVGDQNNSTYLDYTDINAVYTALMIGNANSRFAPQDFWSNIKIPIPKTAEDKMVDGWQYSSLLGIPAFVDWNAGASDLDSLVYLNSLTWTFNIATSYFKLACTDFVSANLSDPAITRLNLTSSPSGTLFLSADLNDNVVFNIPPPHEGSYTVQVPGRTGTIHFASMDTIAGSNDTVWYSRCPYTQEKVESRVLCDGASNNGGCNVTDVNVVAAVQDDFQPLPPRFINAMLNIGRTLLNLPESYTATERYIYYPNYASEPSNSTLVLGAYGSSDPNGLPNSFANITAEVMSQNFGQLVNTLVLAGTQREAFMGGDYALSGSSGIAYDKLNATSRDFGVPSYAPSIAWCVVLLCCSLTLLIASIGTIICERLVLGPDFLGFTNTSIRRGLKMSKEMNQLSARERLQVLSECEILLQDVEPKNPVKGKLALGVREEDSVMLRPGREYR